MICDKINPTCIVKAVCSQLCEQAIKDLRLKDKSFDSYFKLIETQSFCPKCGYDRYKIYHNMKTGCEFCKDIPDEFFNTRDSDSDLLEGKY